MFFRDDYFDHIAPLGWLHSVILLPFFSITLILGTATLIAGAVTPIILGPLQSMLHASADVLLWIVAWIDRLSPEFHGISAAAFQAIYVVVVAALALTIPFRRVSTMKHLRARHRSLPWVVPLAAGWTVLGFSLLKFDDGDPNQSLAVTHLAVGRGTAAVIEFPRGEVWLYDCGTNWNFDPGASVVAPFLRTRGIDAIDRVLITHANMDHYNGLFGLLDSMRVGPIVLNSEFDRFCTPGGAAQAMLDELERRVHPIERINTATSMEHPGNIPVDILWPPSAATEIEFANDTSTVMRIEFSNRSILLCGDIEEDAMSALLERGDLKADILILPHHGSLESNTEHFIAAVDPAICIRSSNQSMDGASNALWDALDRRPIFNTADDGAITCTIAPGGEIHVSGYLRGQLRLPARSYRAGN